MSCEISLDHGVTRRRRTRRRVGTDLDVRAGATRRATTSLSQLRAVQAIVTHLERFPVARARAACARAHFFANYTYQGIGHPAASARSPAPPVLAAPRSPANDAAPRFARPSAHRTMRSRRPRRSRHGEPVDVQSGRCSSRNEHLLANGDFAKSFSERITKCDELLATEWSEHHRKRIEWKLAEQPREDSRIDTGILT